MQTSSINLQLMNENQLNKELIFNEAMVKIDSLINLVVEDFITEENINNNSNYIIEDGENKNKISFINVNSNSRQYFLPQKMIVIFVLKKNSFYIFNNDNWSKIYVNSNNENNLLLNDFISISDNFDVNSQNKKIIFLYLNGNTTISLNDVKLNEFTLIIKQNCEIIYNIKWEENILWQESREYKANQVQNNIDIIKFYKLAQEDYYLARYESNYQYQR
jgi:hypothetical protein